MTEKLAKELSAVRHLRGDRLHPQDDGTAIAAKVLRGWMRSAQRLAAPVPALGAAAGHRWGTCRSGLATSGRHTVTRSKARGLSNAVASRGYRRLLVVAIAGTVAVHLRLIQGQIELVRWPEATRARKWIRREPASKRV